MIKPQDISENQLQNIWKKQSFTSTLKTQSGDFVAVLSTGEHNSSASGPDFKNARLRIGNLVYVGDIEIDSDYNNWKTHGHNIDSKYNKVILHISLTNKNNHHYIYTKDGRKVPTLTLEKFVKKELFDKVNTVIQIKNENKTDFIRCNSIAESVELEFKKKYVSRLGIERFSKKCDRIYQRLKELAYLSELKLNEPTIKYSLHPEFAKKEFNSDDFKDKKLWQQLLYELLFESLGYTQNKDIMLKLARAIKLDFIEKNISDGNSILIESLFFNVSGLIPEVKNLPTEEVTEYSRNLADEWEKIGVQYDGEKFSETDWHFFRIRPQNFPTIRIMGGIQYVNMILSQNLIGLIIRKMEEINNLSILINSIRSMLIIRSKGYWKNHYIFDQIAKNEIKYFIGFSRANEIIINIILPFFMVYFDTFGKNELSKKIIHFYNVFEQKDDNKITREVSNSLGISSLLNNTIYAQGMIELYRNYCSRNNCLECEIGKIVFN